MGAAGSLQKGWGGGPGFQTQRFAPITPNNIPADGPADMSSFFKGGQAFLQLMIICFASWGSSHWFYWHCHGPWVAPRDSVLQLGTKRQRTDSPKEACPWAQCHPTTRRDPLMWLLVKASILESLLGQSPKRPLLMGGSRLTGAYSTEQGGKRVRVELPPAQSLNLGSAEPQGPPHKPASNAGSQAWERCTPSLLYPLPGERREIIPGFQRSEQLRNLCTQSLLYPAPPSAPISIPATPGSSLWLS